MDSSFWLAKARSITAAELQDRAQCAVLAVPAVQCEGRWLGHSVNLISRALVPGWFTRCESRSITHEVTSACECYHGRRWLLCEPCADAADYASMTGRGPSCIDCRARACSPCPVVIRVSRAAAEVS